MRPKEWIIAGVLASLTVLMAILGFSLPAAGKAFFYLAYLPVALAAGIWGGVCALGVGLAGLVLITALLGIWNGVAFATLVAGPAILYGYLLRRRPSAMALWWGYWGGVTGFLFLRWGLAAVIIGVNPVDFIGQMGQAIAGDLGGEWGPRLTPSLFFGLTFLKSGTAFLLNGVVLAMLARRLPREMGGWELAQTARQAVENPRATRALLWKVALGVTLAGGLGWVLGLQIIGANLLILGLIITIGTLFVRGR